MKHPGAARRDVEKVLDWLSLSCSERQWTQLESLAKWLAAEAIPGGGLGPDEAQRIWPRHLADSLAFARGWAVSPSRLVDVGSGVGLPGLPLAILWPTTQVTLLDRSERRADLVRRAIRVVGIENARPLVADVDQATETWPAATLRAVAAPERALAMADRVVDSDGQAVIGLRGIERDLPPVPGDRRASVVDVPALVLDGSVSLLIMGPRGH